MLKVGIQVMVVVDKILMLKLEDCLTRLVLWGMVRRFAMVVPTHSFVSFAIIDRIAASSLSPTARHTPRFAIHIHFDPPCRRTRGRCGGYRPTPLPYNRTVPLLVSVLC